MGVDYNIDKNNFTKIIDDIPNSIKIKEIRCNFNSTYLVAHDNSIYACGYNECG